jgi:pSer/pThr/pTyr-binding forkhead associated (FHA) protein
MQEFSLALREAEQELRQMAASGVSWRKESKVRLTVNPGGQEILVSCQAELIIGRASKKTVPDIDLSPFGGSTSGVSRKHSRLLCQNGDWFIEDLGSTNGTFVSGEKIVSNQKVPVKHNDTIRCGQIELHFAVD